MTQLTEKREIDLLGVPFIMGKLKDTRVILARCGVGKVNAAMTATLLIDHFHPRGIVFTGSAGALNPDLAPGDVVIGVKTAQHDVGTLTAKGLAREPTDGISPRKQNPLFFPADPRLLNAATHSMAAVKLKEVAFGQEKRTPKIVKGVIVTGDVFVAERANNEELRRDLQADAVEEESAAVAQVCWEQRVPFLAIRSISDNANNETPVNYMRFYKLAAENSALLVTGIVMYLAKSPALP
jgi:adenosylhomocysteine nucleosidase